MSKPFVSVSIETCNHERFLEQVIIKVPGHIDLIPPEAIGCPERVHPRPEIIVFNDEAGVAGG